MFNRLIISLNKALRKVRRGRAKPENVLLLLPHCLQNKSCDCDLSESIQNCRECGKCKIKDLKSLQEQFQCKAKVVGGGQEAINAARDKNVQTVIAVACEKELAAGILSILGKKVHAIHNKQPFGPCKNTDVEIGLVRETLERVVED